MEITSGRKKLAVTFASPGAESGAYTELRKLIQDNAGAGDYTVTETETPTVAETHSTLQDLFRRLNERR